jgi:hypothetical protein
MDMQEIGGYRIQAPTRKTQHIFGCTDMLLVASAVFLGLVIPHPLISSQPITYYSNYVVQEEYEAKLQRDQEQMFSADSVWQNQVMGTGWSAIRLQRYVQCTNPKGLTGEKTIGYYDMSLVWYCPLIHSLISSLFVVSEHGTVKLVKNFLKRISYYKI